MLIRSNTALPLSLYCMCGVETGGAERRSRRQWSCEVKKVDGDGGNQAELNALAKDVGLLEMGTAFCGCCESRKS